MRQIFVSLLRSASRIRTWTEQLQRLSCCHYTKADLGLTSVRRRRQVCQIAAGSGPTHPLVPARDNGGMPAHDEVDRIVDAWSRERPDLDFAPLQILSRVGRLGRHLERARRSAFTASDLEPWEFDVLAALRRAGSPYQLSPKSLLQQNLVSSGTMTNRIDRLVDRRLVERRTDPHDGRGILVVMTEAGRERVDSAISQLLHEEALMLRGLSKTDQERLSVLLRRLSLDFDSSDQH